MNPIEADPRLTYTAQKVKEEMNAPTTPATPQIDPSKRKLYQEFKSRIEITKGQRRKLVPVWAESIDMRRGKAFTSSSDQDRIVVNLDWALTKQKQAALFSQTPTVRVDHHPESQSAGPWVAAFERKLNDVLTASGVDNAMDECLPDCINAAGFGVVLVSYDSITEEVEVPSVDPSLFPDGVMPDGSPIPMETVPRVIDHRYTIQRISPSDFLWPLEFTGSNFDDATWLGRSGRVTWAEGVRLFGLTEEDRKSVLGEDRTLQDKLVYDTDRDKTSVDEFVGFDEIWYKEHKYDVDCKSYDTLRRLVFITGKENPIDTPWEGQRLEGDKGLIGATKFPIRVLTLTYISDDTIPPSDSAIGRPQVNEINKSRTQMILQRDRSLPVRWFDVNRVDTAIQNSLMRGTWQAMIPVQGDGERIIGEVARASMPQEDFTFDQIVKSDLNEEWSLGPNQTGTGRGVETAEEAANIQSNFQTRVSRERAKVAKFFVGIAEVTGGLICLFEEPTSFGEGFDPGFSRTLSYSILADSTVIVDAQSRLNRLMQFINFTAKSGWVNIEPVMKEIATLSGLDPNAVIRAPEPKPPVEPSISMRLSGAEDMMNPLMLAFMLQSGQAPKPELIEQAKALIVQALTPPPNLPTPQGPPGMGGPPGPGMPPGPGGIPPSSGAPTPSMGGMPPVEPPLPAPPQPGEANPKWESFPRINKRADGESGGYN